MKELDLTQGSVPKVLLHFAVPFLLANVLQALYGGADLFVVGQYDDAASVAAVAIGSQVMQTVTGVILGLTTGTTVLIAIATGAKDYRKTASIIGTSIGLFAAVGAVLTFLMVAFHSRTVQLMHTPPEALADTEAYLWICSLGIPFIIGYNVVCGILRGLGDSRTPLYFVALACALNIVLDFILVGGCHLRAAGAAIATVASQGVSFATALWYLYRKGFHFEFTRRDIRLDGQLCRRVLLLGAPIALQDLLVNFSFLLITVIVNGMGVVASAALGVVEKLIVFAMLPPMAISSAVAAMTARCRAACAYEPLPVCRHRHGIGLRRFGVPLFTIPAGHADGHLHPRQRGGTDGFRLSAGIQHRLHHGEFRVLHQCLFQRAGQFRVPHGTQRDFHLPLPHTFVLQLQSGEFFFFVSHGVCSSVVHFGFADDMYRVYEIQEKKGNYSGLCVRKLLKTDEGKTYFP